MSTIEVNKITPVSGGTATTLGDSGDTFTVTSGATFNASSSNLANRPNVSPLWYNGDMAISQRVTSTTGVTGSGTDGYKASDRMYMYMNNIGTWTFSQESLTSGNAYNAGFSKAFRVDCTTADASPAASDQFWIGMKFEGQDLQLIRKGTSSAQKMTLAFWVKSNKTGTGQVNFRDTDNSRMCSGTYTISSANTWEHKVINIAADTTGVFTNDNAESLQVQWWIDAGSNFTSGTAPTAWEADASADRCANNLSLADNTANDFAITGIQLEVGEYTSSTLPAFQHESYGDNLARCQRYFFKRGLISRLGYGVVGAHTSSAAYGAQVYFPTIMRATPTQSHSNTNTFYFTGAGQNQLLAAGGTLANEGISKFGVSVGGTASGTLTVGYAYWFNGYVDADQYIQWDAEL